MRHELSIPKNRGEVVGPLVATAFVSFFVGLAFLNLCTGARGVGLIGSIIWLALVSAVLWSACREAGGVRAFFTDRLGDVFGKRFVETTDAQPGTVRFGFEFLSRRFIPRSIPTGKIESVGWSTGQATHIAGRDMNDWHVWLWFDHDDLAKSERRRQWKGKADQDVLCIGPDGRKERIEAFGLSFVEFLRGAGTDLVQVGNEANFVRRQ